MMGFRKAILLLLISAGSVAFPLQVVTEGDNVTCKEAQILRDLRVYKDPTMFLPSLAMMYQDPVRGWNDLIRENPLLTTVKGTIHYMQLGPETSFKNFGVVAKIYEALEPRLIPKVGRRDVPIIPVMFCGEDAYRNTLGFVLAEDLADSQKDEMAKGHMPPSTFPNPVPKLVKEMPHEQAPQSNSSSQIPGHTDYN